MKFVWPRGKGGGRILIRQVRKVPSGTPARGARSTPHGSSLANLTCQPPAIAVEVFGFIIAGHDTSSTTLCWGLKHLSLHQRVQQRARKELQEAFPEAKAEGRLPSVTEILKGSTPYVDATLEEILRVGNTAPIVDRDAAQDTTLLGHHVPKGTHVFFMNNGPSMLEPGFDIDESLRSPHARDSKVRPWPAKDIGVFKPERWLAVENGREVFDSQAGPAIPFGLGLRGCYGRRMAQLELKLLMTVFLWKFEFEQCPPELSGFEAVDGVVHAPHYCYARLKKVAY